MEKKPAIVAQRLTELREGIHISQARLAANVIKLRKSKIVTGIN